MTGVFVRLTPDQLARLDAEAARQNCGRSDIIRDLVSTLPAAHPATMPGQLRLVPDLTDHSRADRLG